MSSHFGTDKYYCVILIAGTQYTETSINHIFQRAKKKAGVTKKKRKTFGYYTRNWYFCQKI